MTEEQALEQQQKTKLVMLDSKQKHLFLFTNYDQLNLEDINHSDIVKAWAVLYHFRTKNKDTLLFEEFKTIITRNHQNKCQGHDLFLQFHKLIKELS